MEDAAEKHNVPDEVVNDIPPEDSEVQEDKGVKRKREPEDKGDKGEAPSGHPAPVIPPSEGGPPELKKLRDSPISSMAEVVDVCKGFRDRIAYYAEGVVEKLVKEEKQPTRVNLIQERIKQAQERPVESYLQDLGGVAAYAIHIAGMHSQMVYQALAGLGLVKEDLGNDIQDAELLFDDLTKTVKHICEFYHKLK